MFGHGIEGSARWDRPSRAVLYIGHSDQQIGDTEVAGSTYAVSCYFVEHISKLSDACVTRIHPISRLFAVYNLFLVGRPSLVRIICPTYFDMFSFQGHRMSTESVSMKTSCCAPDTLVISDSSQGLEGRPLRAQTS